MSHNSEGRRNYRIRVLKGATIILTNNQSEIRCTVRNQHADGAELHIPGVLALPDEFLLYVPWMQPLIGRSSAGEGVIVSASSSPAPNQNLEGIMVHKSSANLTDVSNFW